MSIEEELKGHFRNEYHKGLINLTYTAKQLSYEFFQSLKKYGLAEQQYNVLRILRGFRSEAPLSVGFIKERMLDKDSDVSRIIDRLFEKGFLNRTENPNDRRQKSDTLLNNLTPEEINELNRILDKIRERE